MDVFPAYIPLQGKRVLVIGDGEPAEGKARLFAGSPAEVVRRSAPGRPLSPEDFRGFDLVFIALEDAAADAAAAAAARAAGARWVNVVDRPALCDFHTPALVDRGSVVAAAGTGGASPALSAWLKRRIEAVIPERVEVLARVSAAVRDEARRRLPSYAARREFQNALLIGPVAEAALAGREAEALSAARAALEAAAEAPPPEGDA